MRIKTRIPIEMALTETEPIPLGFHAPNFTLPEPLTGKSHTMRELQGERGTVIMFICNHCPYVIHVREQLIALAKEYIPRGIAFIAISSNDVEQYPEDSPEKMAQLAREMNFPFPYLYDESQEVARTYCAACTPDLNLFDAELKCVYRGRLDNSTPGNNKPVTGKDFRHALDAVLSGQPTPTPQFPSMGCNIKWK